MLRKILASSGLLGLILITYAASCNPPSPTPPPTPATPPVSEQCAANNLTCSCWDMPPGSGWLWVCCDPYKHISNPSECTSGSGCPPTPGPTPVPTPIPVCRTTRVDNFRNILKPHSGQQVDYTVVACGGDVVSTNHNCLNNCCELSAEKGNQACADKLYGMPQWFPTKIKLVQVFEDNTYTQKVVEGANGETSGAVRVCGHADNVPGNCVGAQVVVGSPACQVITNSPQGCARNGRTGTGDFFRR